MNNFFDGLKNKSGRSVHVHAPMVFNFFLASLLFRKILFPGSQPTVPSQSLHTTTETFVLVEEKTQGESLK
jgi:hypothetical protein